MLGPTNYNREVWQYRHTVELSLLKLFKISIKTSNSDLQLQCGNISLDLQDVLLRHFGLRHKHEHHKQRLRYQITDALNDFAQYNQWDETFHNFFISVRRCTCFRRFFYPSSGAQNCAYSVRPILLPAASLARLAAGLTSTWRCMCSFELLMMDGKIVWNMYSVLQK